MGWTEALIVLAVYVLGYWTGKLQKGITIAIKNDESDVPTEYNESLADELPPEIKSYYDKNRGYNRFD